MPTPITSRGREWEMANSAWLIWSVIPVLWPVALIYAGTRARQPRWSWAGALYALPMVLSWVTPGPLQALLHALTGVAWFAALIHALVLRAPYLRRLEQMEERGQALARKIAEAREVIRAAVRRHPEAPTWPVPPTGADAPAPQPQPPAVPPERQAPPPKPAKAPVPKAPVPKRPVRLPPAPMPAPAAPAAPVTGIDLNTATVLDLALLPGMNMDLAHRAVRRREQQGKFASLQEFAEAIGLDAQALAGMQGKIRV